MTIRIDTKELLTMVAKPDIELSTLSLSSPLERTPDISEMDTPGLSRFNRKHEYGRRKNHLLMASITLSDNRTLVAVFDYRVLFVGDAKHLQEYQPINIIGYEDCQFFNLVLLDFIWIKSKV